MKCVVISGTLRYAEGNQARDYNVGDEVNVSSADYKNLGYMLKPSKAVAAEKKAAQIVAKAKEEAEAKRIEEEDAKAKEEADRIAEEEAERAQSQG